MLTYCKHIFFACTVIRGFYKGGFIISRETTVETEVLLYIWGFIMQIIVNAYAQEMEVAIFKMIQYNFRILTN